jgi:uncharacterized protein YjiS (DUF1127 family)
MTLLTRSALRWIEEHRRRAVMRRLLDHDDRMLSDMGLVRTEVELALQLPMTENARAAASAASRRAFRAA